MYHLLESFEIQNNVDHLEKIMMKIVYAISVISILLLFLSLLWLYVFTRIHSIIELFKNYVNIKYVRIINNNLLLNRFE